MAPGKRVMVMQESERHTPISQLSRDELFETLDVLRAFIDDAIVHGETSTANAFLTAACRIARHIDKVNSNFTSQHGTYIESDINAPYTAPTRATYARIISKLQKP